MFSAVSTNKLKMYDGACSCSRGVRTMERVRNIYTCTSSSRKGGYSCRELCVHHDRVDSPNKEPVAMHGSCAPLD